MSETPTIARLPSTSRPLPPEGRIEASESAPISAPTPMAPGEQAEARRAGGEDVAGVQRDERQVVQDEQRRDRGQQDDDEQHPVRGDVAEAVLEVAPDRGLDPVGGSQVRDRRAGR